MESEKVKEIKKALEDNKTDHLPYIDGYKCKFVDYSDILTLINELESENERLKILLAQANAGIVNCSGCKLVELNAVKEFAEKLKMKAFDKDMFNDWAGATYVVLVREIDKLLKEYEKCDK